MSSSSRRLARIRGLPPDVVSKLKEHNVTTCRDFLTRHPLELMTILALSYPQLLQLMEAVSSAIAPKPQTVFAAYEARRKSGLGFLPTSLHKLDSVLHGGLPAGTITEVVGPPGSGKTQLCLMLSVVATLPSFLGGLGTKVAYIDTEAAFTAERLIEVAKARYVRHFSSVENLVSVAGSVHVFPELTSDCFMRRLETLDLEIANRGIGLVIVDSIASLIRKEFDTRTERAVAERARLLGTQASRLKYLAEAFEIPIVVTNQITTHVSHDWMKRSDWSNEGGMQKDESVVTAALGNTWSHCINTRLLLEYMQGTRRRLTVAKSPLCDCESFVVTIEEKGLVLDWMATVELAGEQRGDPTMVSMAVRSSTEDGLGVEFPGQYS